MENTWKLRVEGGAFWVVIGAQWLGAGPAIAEVQWYFSSPRFGGAVQCSHDAVGLL